jgi:acyl-CoA thioester hydrolase
MNEAPKPHVFPVRVYFEDTDAGGVVYYANFLKFAERARTELLRELGVQSSALIRDQGVALVARRCLADYLKPARLDDQLEVHTRVLEVRGASVRAEQRILGNGDDLVRLDLELACMSTSGRVARLPAGLRDSLAGLCHNESQV